VGWAILAGVWPQNRAAAAEPFGSNGCKHFLVEFSGKGTPSDSGLRGYSFPSAVTASGSLNARFQGKRLEFVWTDIALSGEETEQITLLPDPLDQRNLVELKVRTPIDGTPVATTAGVCEQGNYLVSMTQFVQSKETLLRFQLGHLSSSPHSGPPSPLRYETLALNFAETEPFALDSSLLAPIHVSYLPTRNEILAVVHGIHQPTFVVRWRLEEGAWRLASLVPLPIRPEDPETSEAGKGAFATLSEQPDFDLFSSFMGTDSSERNPSASGKHFDSATAIAVFEKKGWVALGGQDGDVFVFSPESNGESPLAFQRMAGAISALAFDSSGRLAISKQSGKHSEVSIWDVPDTLIEYPESAYQSSLDNRAILWLATHHTRAVETYSSQVQALAFSPSDAALAVGLSKQIHLIRFDTETGKRLRSATEAVVDLTKGADLSRHAGLRGQVERLRWVVDRRNKHYLLVHPLPLEADPDRPFFFETPQ
jgi:hypothetical protein